MISKLQIAVEDFSEASNDRRGSCIELIEADRGRQNPTEALHAIGSVYQFFNVFLYQSLGLPVSSPVNI